MSSDPDFKNPNGGDGDELPTAEFVSPAEQLQIPTETGAHDGQSFVGAETMGRLHPTSLVFDLVSHVRSLVVPLLLGAFGVAKGNFGYLVVAGMFFVPTVVFSVIRYMSLQYRIQDGELVVTKGIFFRRVRTVPLERIQNIDLVQSLFHRMFNVAEVRVETASGTEPEATLRVLSIADVERLRAIVFEKSRKTGETDSSQVAEQKQFGELAGGTSAANFDSSEAAETLLSIPILTLIKAGLASNRGSVLIGVLAGLYFQFDLEEHFDVKEIEKWIPQGLSTAQQILYCLLYTSDAADE